MKVCKSVQAYPSITCLVFKAHSIKLKTFTSTEIAQTTLPAMNCQYQAKVAIFAQLKGMQFTKTVQKVIVGSTWNGISHNMENAGKTLQLNEPIQRTKMCTKCTVSSYSSHSITTLSMAWYPLYILPCTG